MIERGIKIVQLLIANPGYKIKDIEKYLNLTRRQINYSLNQLNDTLDSNGLPKIGRNKKGDFFIPNEIFEMFTQKSSRDFNSKSVYSEKNREKIIIMYIAIAKEFVSLAHIIDLLNISKSTVMEDINSARITLKKYNLRITYDRTSGYDIEGKELDIRRLISNLLNQDNSFLINALSEYLIIEKDEMIHYIRNVEKSLNIKYSDASFNYLVNVLGFTITRIFSNRVKEKDFFINQVNSTVEYDSIIKIFPNDWNLTRSDYEWINLLFLSSNVYQTNQLLTLYNDLDSIVDTMILDFENKTLVNIENKSEFKLRLIGHIRPSIFRIKFNLKFSKADLSSLIEDKEHSLLIDVVKEILHPLEEVINEEFPLDEVKLISLYFGYQLKNYDRQGSRPKAVTVCNNGLISSKLLIENLKSLLPEINFLTSLSEREFYKYQADYDIVFTTNLLDTDIPQFKVDTLMSKKDELNLRFNVLEAITGNSQAFTNKLNDLLGIIKKYSTIRNYSELKEELKYFLMDNGSNDSIKYDSDMPNLSDYIEKSSIQLISSNLNWKEAINSSCQPLIKKGYIDSKYVDNLIKVVENTDYMYIGNYIVIPHVADSENIERDCIALSVSKDTIKFPNDKEVRIIIPIAIKDTTKHLNAIRQLFNLGRDKTAIDKLCTMTISEIYDFISHLPKNSKGA
ncbi:BglG family transcription antiterminator [Aerococcus loyolae]